MFYFLHLELCLDVSLMFSNIFDVLILQIKKYYFNIFLNKKYAE
jgi:hypothetical protein